MKYVSLDDWTIADTIKRVNAQEGMDPVFQRDITSALKRVGDMISDWCSGMLNYPIELAGDSPCEVTVPDFPEISIQAQSREDGQLEALNAIEEAISTRIESGESVPEPSRGTLTVHLPTQTAVKAMLYNLMKEKGVDTPTLARRLHWDVRAVEQLLNITHANLLHHVTDAFKALDYRLKVEIVPQEQSEEEQAVYLSYRARESK